ncbi:acyl-CoA dehydrogenase family protein [Sorangium sp. So ce1128]
MTTITPRQVGSGGGAPVRYAVTPAELITRAESLRATLVRRSPEADQLTRYPPSTHEDFLRAGFYRMLVPRRYGGLECDMPTFARVVMALARGCPSSSWSLALGAGHALQIASWFGEAAQEQIFGGEHFSCASNGFPIGTARPIDGGWEIDGTFPYASGSPHATHFMGQTLSPGEAPDGPPGPPLLFVAPRSAWTLVDDWGGMLGLNGTGSNSVRLDKVRIPDHLVVQNLSLHNHGGTGDSPGLRLHGNPMYTGRALGFFSIELAAVAVGAGKAAIDEYEVVMQSRKTTLPPIVPRAEDPDFQRWLGIAITRVDTAEAIVLQGAARYMELCKRDVEEGIRFGREDDLRLFTSVVEAINIVWDTVQNYVYRTAGPACARDGERLQRLFRDLAMIWGHGITVRTETGFRLIAKERHLHARP